MSHRREEMKKVRVVGFLAVLVFLGSMVGSYTVTEVLAGQSSAPPDNGGKDIITPTVEEAEGLAGYKAAIPSFLPQGFERGNIVVGLPLHQITEDSHTITQYWGSPSGEYIILIQDPDLDGLIGGEPITIAGGSGERGIFPALGNRSYEIVGFSWREGNMAFSVGGSLTGSLTEDLVRQVANSVEYEQPN
jgi:hypothetical protein